MITGFFLGFSIAAFLWLIFKCIGSFEKMKQDVEDVKFDLEVLKTERDFYKNELDIHKTWTDFLPGDIKEGEVGPIQPKYDPDDVPGVLDKMFVNEKDKNVG